MSITIPGSEYTGPKCIAEEVSRRDRENGFIEVTCYHPLFTKKLVHFQAQWSQELDNLILGALSDYQVNKILTGQPF